METPTLMPGSSGVSAPVAQALGVSPSAQVDLNPTSQYYQENTLPYQLGQWLSGRAGAAYNAVNPALSHGPLLAALGVGAAGLAGGYLGRKAKNVLNDEDEPGSSWAVPAGLAGLGLGAWLGYNRLKQASGLVGADPDIDRQQIQLRLLQDVTLDSQQRHAFVQAVGQLSDSQVSELSRIIGGLLGASVGAVVAKYLLHLGLFGTGVAAAAGGWLGSHLLARPNFQPTAVGTRGPAFSSYFGM